MFKMFKRSWWASIVEAFRTGYAEGFEEAVREGRRES